MESTLPGIILQSKIPYIAEGDPVVAVITLAVIAGIIVLAVIVSRLSAGRRGAPLSPAAMQKYNKSLFKKMAINYGFSPKQVKFLERLMVLAKVKQPLLIFSNTRALDDALKNGIYAIEHERGSGDEVKEDYINSIFEIKQTIDRHLKHGIGIRSTHFLKAGQTMVLTNKEGLKIHSKVMNNRSDGIFCSLPTAPTITTLLHKGQEIKVFFWRDNDSGYSFSTRVLKSEDSRGLPTFVIQHAKKLTRVQQRRFNRKPLGNSCFFYPVELLASSNKRDPRKKIVIHNDRRHLGAVSDISAGGMRIQSKMNFPAGSYIKVEFDIILKTSITAIGKVQSAKRESSEGVTMHVVFKKISKKNLNQIYSYVFNYI